jgi:hypothetical protein
LVIKPLEEDHTPGTPKPFQVSLVEPVAYSLSYLVAVLKRYPQYFQRVGRVDPPDNAAPDHLSLLVQEQGLRGVHLSPGADAAADWIRGLLKPPLWSPCLQLKVPMTLLVPIVRVPDAGR